MKVAYCTGFWCTNIGNGFFGLGVDYALKKILDEKNVTIVSDLQTYTTSYGKRLYVSDNQLEYISKLEIDFVVLAGPVINKYFLGLWKDILLKLQDRGVGYILLSTGVMKLDMESREAIKDFFTICPPYAFSSRDEFAYREFGVYAKHAYNGICFSFYAPEAYNACGIKDLTPYIVYNFDKISEPFVWLDGESNREATSCFEFMGEKYCLANSKIMTALSSKTDRFTDALAYIMSVFPARKRKSFVGRYRVVRTDHRFHPHFRRKIYRQPNSYVADLPYGYLNLYANAELTLSDRVHACAVALAFGNSAMLFSKTNRSELLERVGATDICNRPVKLDMELLNEEKEKQLQWLRDILTEER